MTKNFTATKAHGLPDIGIYGLPTSEDHSALVYLPVPWDATTSYRPGTSHGPDSVFRASEQIDFFDQEIVDAYAAGMHMLPVPETIEGWNTVARAKAKAVVDSQEDLAENFDARQNLAQVNELCSKMNDWVYEESKRLIANGKLVGVLGGDHSVPFGAIKALADEYASFGILHFDAHLDLRMSYQGFTYSHASIMRNVMEEIPQVKKLVQVGIRDYSEEEYSFVKSKRRKIKPFFDNEIYHRQANGTAFGVIANEIVDALPTKVYISFDIDGLDPKLCPDTGTPVPGGLDFHHVQMILRQLVRAGKRVIGFDLCEVSPGPHYPESFNEWNANVGMRMLYKLSSWTLLSQKKIKARPGYSL
jgi:agmatinase